MRAIALLLTALACHSMPPQKPGLPPAAGGGVQARKGVPSVPGQRALRYLYDHTNSGIREPAREIIRDSVALAHAWRRLYARDFTIPDAPPLDFGAHTGLLVAMGERPTTGYELAIDSVSARGDTLSVYVAHFERNPSCIEGSALTFPALLVAVPRHDGPVVFHTERRLLGCLDGPPRPKRDTAPSP